MPSTLETCANTAGRPSGSLGDTVYQEDTKQIITYDGSAWIEYDSDSASGYDLDGTNVISALPAFHFDAEKFNGVDATGNPSDATTIDTSTVWTSRVGGITASQDTSANQPSYKTTGTNSKPYVLSTAFMYLELSEIISAPGPFTVFAVSEATAAGKSATIGDGVFKAEAPKANIQFIWSNTNYLYYSATGADSGALPLAINGAETRAFLMTRDSSDNTNFFMDGDNETGTVVGTNSDTQFISSIMACISPYGLIGNMYEIAVWTSDLSSADRNILGVYAQAKYDASNLGWTNF